MDQARLNQLRHEDRKQLDALLEATNGAMNALRRDECGDWTITGSRGTIRACDGKFYVYIPSGSAKAWTYVKRALASFATVSQDGDDEGVLVMSRMPDEDEAESRSRPEVQRGRYEGRISAAHALKRTGL
jgi:hypothetical protein